MTAEIIDGKAFAARVREQVAALADVAPEQVIFTGGGTEADWLALNGAEPVRADTLRLVASQGATLVLSGVAIASIGPITSETLRKLGLNVDIEAKESTIPGLVAALINCFSSRK